MTHPVQRTNILGMLETHLQDELDLVAERINDLQEEVARLEEYQAILRKHADITTRRQYVAPTRS
jgi:hypothetical protein